MIVLVLGDKYLVITVIIVIDSKICTKSDRKITHCFLPQCAQNASNCISGPLCVKNFPEGHAPVPP